MSEELEVETLSDEGCESLYPTSESSAETEASGDLETEGEEGKTSNCGDKLKGKSKKRKSDDKVTKLIGKKVGLSQLLKWFQGVHVQNAGTGEIMTVSKFVRKTLPGKNI